MQAVSVNSSKSPQVHVSIKQRSAPLEPLVADRLLDLLSTDNDFRRLFKSNPLAALIKAGYQAPDEHWALARPPIYGCCKVKRIASKADIIKARAEIKAMLTTGLPYITPSLDATITASRLTRK